MIDLQTLLFERGLPRDARTKLVRHQDQRFDLERLLALGEFDIYQTHQSKPVFSDCDYIVSFLGRPFSQARLLGVYKVGTPAIDDPTPLPPGFSEPSMGLGKYRYPLEKAVDFADLERRVVIDWGGSTRAWHQWLTKKEVVEILPAGFVRAFPGYYDFVLPFAELKEIVENEPSNREWHRRLSMVAGIYLITDRTIGTSSSGKQYVGSAYGHKGILGRWTSYAKTGHGDNKLLKDLLDVNGDHAKHFSFTILRTLDRTLTDKEVFEYEKLYKEKLGSRAVGLNPNGLNAN